MTIFSNIKSTLQVCIFISFCCFATFAKAGIIGIDCIIDENPERKVSIVFDSESRSAQWLPQVKNKYLSPYFGAIFDASITETELAFVFERPDNATFRIAISRLTGNGEYQPLDSKTKTRLACSPNEALKEFVKPILFPDNSNNISMVCRQYILPTKEQPNPNQDSKYNDVPDEYFISEKTSMSAAGNRGTVEYVSPKMDRLISYYDGHYQNPRFVNLVTGMNWDFDRSNGQVSAFLLFQCVQKPKGVAAQRKF